MRLLQYATNHSTGVRYQLLFDSREWEWVVRAKDHIEPKWVTICRFTNLDLAEEYFGNIVHKPGRQPKYFTGELQ